MPNTKKSKKIKPAKVAGEFKKFITRGNIIDMAVGVIIGGAFGKIVSSLVNDIIMPPINMLMSGMNATDLKFVLRSAIEADPDNGIAAVSEISINYGNFFQTILDFLIIALSIFFLVKFVANMRVRMEKLRAEEIERRRTAEEREKIAAEAEAKRIAEEAAKNAPPKPTTEELLTQIRDLLATNKNNQDK